MDILAITITGVALLAAGVLLIFFSGMKAKRISDVKAMISAGWYDQAAAFLNKLMKKDDSNPLTHYLLAEVSYHKKNFDMAVVEYKQSLKLLQKSNKTLRMSIRNRLAEVYIRNKQPVEAQKEYLLLLEEEPRNAEHMFNIGRIFYDRGMKDQAFTYLDMAAKAGKAGAQVHFMLGRIYFDFGQNHLALIAFNNSLKFDPKNLEAHYYLGCVHMAGRDFAGAIKEFEMAELTPNAALKSRALFKKGQCRSETGDDYNAAKDFEDALDASPESDGAALEIRYKLGLLYEKDNKVIKALEQYEAIAKVRPDYMDVQDKIGKFGHLNLHDHLKDLMTVSPDKFREMGQNVVKELGYDIMSIRLTDNDTLDVIGLEKSQKWRDEKGGKALIRVHRGRGNIGKAEIAGLLDEQKSMHGPRAVYITTEKFSAEAVQYAGGRPVDLIDRDKLLETLKKRESWF